MSLKYFLADTWFSFVIFHYHFGKDGEQFTVSWLDNKLKAQISLLQPRAAHVLTGKMPLISL